MRESSEFLQKEIAQTRLRALIVQLRPSLSIVLDEYAKMSEEIILMLSQLDHGEVFTEEDVSKMEKRVKILLRIQ